MKKYLSILAVAAVVFVLPPVSAARAADTYHFDPAHTTVTWSANHFGFSDPHGVFSLIEGTLSLDETDPAKSNVDVTINSGNLFTGNKKFDDHLKSKDFFNIGEFPKITFRSSKVELTGPKTAKVTGNLEMLGKTQPVVLDVTYNKKGPNVLSGKTTVGFSAKTVVKRSLFGMVFATPGVSDDVQVDIQAEAN